MTLATYDPESSVLAARALYFAVNRFGDDGGYGDAWVDFKLGPIPMPFPNTAGRIAAVKVHDLHHIVTGYDTDTAGEMEIAAWEIGAGCKSFTTAWIINLSGLFTGACFWPKRTFRAFLRGRRSESLYERPLDELLSLRVAELRARTRIDRDASPATPTDVVLFALALVAGGLAGLALLTLILPLVPVGLIASAMRAPKAAKA